MSRVLIIDDDELITGPLFQILGQKGVPADLATNPRDADSLLAKNDYALVLMDAYLTGQLSSRALELVDQVRSRRPKAQVLLLTAYGSAALDERVRNDARIMVVAKPQPVPYLADLIGGFLRRERVH
jgi:DNA-binding NtrC family response regulator